MARIERVELGGFKGQNRGIPLDVRNLLSGPNGLGKSAILEAVRFAINGDVPTGRQNDEIARYFPPEGGSVRLADDNGDWIVRQVFCDPERATVSTRVESEGDWTANQALLDMRGFLGLSANKRREFVLELVGAGEEPTDADIHKILAREYAREIGGPGATPAILAMDENDDLPPEIRPLANAWLRCWGVLSSYLRTGESTASAIFQRLADAARERKNGARRAHTEAKAALRELESVAKGAGPAAAELEKCRRAVDEATEALSRGRALVATYEAAMEGFKAAGDEREALAERLETASGELQALGDPGPRPEMEAEDLRQLQNVAAEAESRLAEVQRALASLERIENRIKTESAVLAAGEKELEALHEEPIGRAVNSVAEIRKAPAVPSSEAFPVWSAVEDLLGAIDAIAVSWNERKAALLKHKAELQEDLQLLENERSERAKEIPREAEFEDLETAVGDAKQRLDDANETYRERHREYHARLRKWEDETNALTKAQATVEGLKERYEAARQRHSALRADLEDRSVPLPVRALADDVDAAKEALQLAEEAAGAVRAYEEAETKATREKVATGAWKAIEAACKHAREAYVADVVKPLVGEIGALLTAAGRPEKVYIDLENDRGKPIFDLGWVLNGSKRSLSALSGGESALFTTALALTIARRAPGRKILLIEADPLDEENLRQLLTALTQMDVELDACLVATSTEVDFHDGWKVFRYSRQTEKAR